ncbi:MAG: ACP S-malonyltransferase [Mycobacteriales bacterium]
MLALLAPGQGSQRPGQLAPWLDLPGVAEQVDGLGEAAGLDLRYLGTTASADELRPTEVAQPLLVATGIVVAAQLASALPASAQVAAGHSVGEWTSADAVALVRVRGLAMAAAGAQSPGGMAAVLGGDPDEIRSRAAALDLAVANVNGAGQLVVGGPLAGLHALIDAPPAGSRVRLLPVAGAFHTPAMAPAEADLARAAAATVVGHPTMPVVSNADGELVTSGGDLLARLVRQVTQPVRWDRCLASLGRLGVTVAVEICPAGVLAALARRELPGVAVLRVDTPEDLLAAVGPADLEAVT